MSNLYRDLNEAALAANLNKNPLLVFHAMMNQTFGFAKASDPLTDHRLAKLTGIRPDRLRGAIDVVVGKGLFDCKPHPRFGNEYSIGKRFLEAHYNRVSTPSVPKKRRVPEKQNPLFGTPLKQPENRVHTETTNTIKNTNLISSPPQQTSASVPLAEQQPSSVKIFFAEREQIPDSFAIETSSANTRIEFAFGKPSTQDKPLAKASEAPATSKPDTAAKLKKINKIIKKQPQQVAQSATSNPKPPAAKKPIPTPKTSTKTATAVPAWHEAQDAAIAYLDRMIGRPEFNADPFILPATPQKARGGHANKTTKTDVPLPKAIDEENRTACERQLRSLTPKQQKDVITVFDFNLKQGNIRSKANYFISLTRSAKEGGLTIPDEAIIKPKKSTKDLATDKERERRFDLWSNFVWLRDNAAREGVAIAELVKTADEKMQEAYAMFGQVALQ